MNEILKEQKFIFNIMLGLGPWLSHRAHDRAPKQNPVVRVCRGDLVTAAQNASGPGLHPEHSKQEQKLCLAKGAGHGGHIASRHLRGLSRVGNTQSTEAARVQWVGEVNGKSRISPGGNDNVL